MQTNEERRLTRALVEAQRDLRVIVGHLNVLGAATNAKHTLHALHGQADAALERVDRALGGEA